MTKKRKSRHRVPAFTPRPEPISERYMAEVERCTTRLEQRYRHAQRALAKAESRAEAAAAAQPVADRSAFAKREYARLLALVEERRKELRIIAALMVPEPVNSRDRRRRKAWLESGNGIHPVPAFSGPRGAS